MYNEKKSDKKGFRMDFTIHAFMRTELNLKGCELTIFAVIYECTKKNGKFSGSLKQMGEIVGCNLRTVHTVVSSLANRGLIKKEIGKVGFTHIPISEYTALIH